MLFRLSQLNILQERLVTVSLLSNLGSCSFKQNLSKFFQYNSVWNCTPIKIEVDNELSYDGDFCNDGSNEFITEISDYDFVEFVQCWTFISLMRIHLYDRNS